MIYCDIRRMTSENRCMTLLRNAVFIDRDGVIIEDSDYVYKAQTFLSFGSIEALQTPLPEFL